MIKQKIVSVNIAISTDSDYTKELEFDILNKYLEEGYTVSDRFSTVSNSTSLYINITFILQKDLGEI